MYKVILYKATGLRHIVCEKECVVEAVQLADELYSSYRVFLDANIAPTAVSVVVLDMDVSVGYNNLFVELPGASGEVPEVGYIVYQCGSV